MKQSEFDRQVNEHIRYILARAEREYEAEEPFSGPEVFEPCEPDDEHKPRSAYHVCSDRSTYAEELRLDNAARARDMNAVK